MKRGYSCRRYLHIEAVFVFGNRPDHWCAPSGGQAIQDCPHQRAGHVQPHHDTNKKRESRLPHSPGFGNDDRRVRYID
jgi:hypothetical protein